jgi:hypothetical protein
LAKEKDPAAVKLGREEWEGVSGELLFRIPEDFRPATILRSAIGRSFHPL